MPPLNNDTHQLCYAMGAMVLTKEHPRDLRYWTAEPVLTPVATPGYRATDAYVVFPTGIDQRNDIGAPDRFDTSLGMDD